MTDANDAMLALAAHDEAVVRARHDAARPPTQAALDDATARLAALASAKRDLDAQRAPLLARVAELEAKAATARQRVAVIQERLASATGAGRDLAAMDEERASLERFSSGLDDELLELLEVLEPLDASDEELVALATRTVAERDAASAAVDAERASAAAALEALDDARCALAAQVPAALLARYEAAARRVGGAGAARLVDARCGGCRVAVPAAVADRLEHGGDEAAVELCDECGRLLVR